MEVKARSHAGSRLVVDDGSGVGEARRAALALAQRLGLDETRSGQAALVATEMASNLVKHAGGGEVILRGIRDPERVAIELLALDRGPGIANLGQSLRDGVSTGSTPGTGLGAIRRGAALFDVFSQPGRGTALLARVESKPPHAGALWECHGVAVPHPAESVTGDAWAALERGGAVRVMVADGLGHGPDAAAAAEAAVGVFLDRPSPTLPAVLEDCHRALRPTRGAAVLVAEVDPERGEVRCAGVGNVAATLWTAEGTRSLVSLNGTLGHGEVRLREFSYPWTAGSLLVLASDGLRTQWSLQPYPGLALRDPALIAGVLYRDYKRGSDDATVVVLRARGGSRP
jgi:anti-sigma regulatory factor (Ser/Thr protein kinase)